MIEQLEARIQYASLSGTVFNDADNSETLSAGEKSYSGWQVYIDSNGDGQYEAGEPTTTTDAKGNYTFKDLQKGTYLIGVVPAISGETETTPGVDGSIQAGVHINLDFTSSITASYSRAFVNAAEKWESILTGIRINGGIVPDYLTIKVSVVPIDGLGSGDGIDILGQSAPTSFDSATGLPSAGFMHFDIANIKELDENGTLQDTITHEMAHVLGFGTVWNQKEVTAGNATHDPRFIGANAVAAFNELFDTHNLSIPLDNSGIEGTDDAHWSETVLTQELMTGVISPPGTPNPLSIITVGQFEDLGYQVDYKPADVWNPLTSPETVVKHTALDAGGVADERSVQLALHTNDSGLDFGYRVETVPTINNYTISPSPVATDETITLSAAKVIDYNDESINGVSFWRESNGIAGLQTGAGGDTFIAAETTPRRHAYTVTTSTDNLTGDQVYYAVVTDSLGLSGHRTGVIDVTTSTIPPRPTDVVASRDTSTSATVTFDDTNTDVLGYRVRLATSSDFDSQTIIQQFNIAADSRSFTLSDLVPGQEYYVDIRPYNSAGAGQYTTATTFETI